MPVFLLVLSASLVLSSSSLVLSFSPLVLFFFSHSFFFCSRSNILVLFSVSLASLSSFLCFNSRNTGESVIQLALEFTACRFFFGATGFGTTFNVLTVLPPR